MQISKTRLGLNHLLGFYPGAEVARVVNQNERVIEALRAADRVEIFRIGSVPTGPGVWTVVDLLIDETVHKFAILNTTGNVYRTEPDGAVEDDPFIVTEHAPSDSPATQA